MDSSLADDREYSLDPRSITASRVAGGIFIGVLGTQLKCQMITIANDPAPRIVQRRR